MSAGLYLQPLRALQDGIPSPGASLDVYAESISTRASIYADGSRSVALSNPLQADASGAFVPVYLDPAGSYRIICTSADGVELFDIDPAVNQEPLGIDADVLTESGAPLPLATLTCYASGTTGLQPIYADANGAVELDNPLTANNLGEFPDVFMDEALAYRVLLEDRRGVLLYDIDPVRVFSEDSTVLIDEDNLESGAEIGSNFTGGNQYMLEPLLTQWQSGDVHAINIASDGAEYVLQNLSDTASFFFDGFWFKPGLQISVFADNVTINLDSSLLEILGLNDSNGSDAIMLLGVGGRTGVTLNITNQIGASIGTISKGVGTESSYATQAVRRVNCVGTTNILSGAAGITGAVD